MKLQWALSTYAAYAKTDFAQFSVDIDEVHTAGGMKRYAARIDRLRVFLPLARADDFKTIRAVQSWCEDAYADLLRAELARLAPEVSS